MKNKDLYKLKKRNYQEYVLIFSTGIFYTCYYDDAYIINYFFNYEIKDDKIGFPKNSLCKVIKILDEQAINYLIIDNNIKKEFENNQYQIILKNANNIYFNNLNTKIMIDTLIKKIKEHPEKNEKIWEFINEL